jgi:hypothetical protein
MRWKKQSAIQQKIDEHLRLSKQNSERQMIVERQMRIADMAVMLQKLKDIVRERAKTPEMRGVPGGSTGLMRRRKISFRRPHGPLCDYELDTGLLRESRRLLVAVAKALGQWQRPKYRPIACSTNTIVASGKQHRAALLIADGTSWDLEIAAACGINRRTLVSLSRDKVDAMSIRRTLLIMLTMAAMAPQLTASDRRTLLDVVYGHASGQDLKLDAFLCDSAKASPAVIYIHGGGWRQGDKRPNEKTFRVEFLILDALKDAMQSARIAVVSINYRLSDWPFIRRRWMM